MPRPALPADASARAAARSALLRDAEASAGAGRLVGREHTFRGITATLTRDPVVDEHGALSLHVRAWIGRGANRTELDLGDGHFRFVNPPLLVDDPAGDIVATDEDTDAVRRLSYAPLRALREIVWDALERFAP